MFEELQAYIERSQARRDAVQQAITEQQVQAQLAKNSKFNVKPLKFNDPKGKGKGGPGGKSGGGSNKGGISLKELMNRIGAKESGGNYKALGDWNSGDRAYGKYQIMGNNIPSWTKAYLGHSLTPQQFLNRPHAQEKVARGKLRYYYRRYGPGGAAAAWYAGESAAKGWKSYRKSNYSDNGTEYPSVYEYVLDILRRG